ncbi:hypothetical protein NZ698_12145 [Chryseobacterium sp. PBS4-4]|uniref:Uncharacterized protein n=1 Tax=Chryseobacterium edaphi TaxID=2976532 RepID=A0ABT2W6X1_9FLAO|nr:hypothetical protein [Chryseobacterium edaphi]MCU7617951.1 hypothetical protein [Chryseobacterium edaphi]
MYGSVKGLKENQIKTLKLKQGNKVLRSVELISGKSILVKDSLNTEYYDFDDENRLISVKSVKDNWEQNFILNFKDNNINQVSRKINNNGIVVFNKFSKVLFNNSLYEEREVYNFDSKKNDSLYVFRTRYFFNQENPDLSYKETYDNRNVWSKKYFNQTEVRKKVFKDYFIVDSTLQKDYKVTKYHFENYPNRQIIIIEKDSIITIHKENEKKVSEKLEYAGLPFREIFYNENENVKEKIIYRNYQNTFNDWILWEERKYDGKGKLISRRRPNKKEYKLINGVLTFRSSVSRINTRDYIWSDHKRKYFEYYYAKIYSPSILLNLNVSNRLIQNFDTTSIFESDEMIYMNIKFQNDTKIISEYSSSEDVRKEGIRTAKTLRRYSDSYFTDLEVEAETFSEKKYSINICENLNLLSFPIHTFLIKEEN